MNGKMRKPCLAAALLALTVLLSGCWGDPIREYGKELEAVRDVDIPVESADGTVHSRILLRDSLVSNRPSEQIQTRMYELTAEGAKTIVEGLFPEGQVYADAAPRFSSMQEARERQAQWLRQATPEVLRALYGPRAQEAGEALAAPIDPALIASEAPAPCDWQFRPEGQSGQEVLRLRVVQDGLCYRVELRRGPDLYGVEVELSQAVPAPMEFEKLYAVYGHFAEAPMDREASFEVERMANYYALQMNRGLGGWSVWSSLQEPWGPWENPEAPCYVLRCSAMPGSVILPVPRSAAVDRAVYPFGEVLVTQDGTLLSGSMWCSMEEVDYLPAAEDQLGWREGLDVAEQYLQGLTASALLPEGLDLGPAPQVELTATVMQTGQGCVPDPETPGAYLYVPAMQLVGDFAVVSEGQTVYRHSEATGEPYLVVMVNLLDGGLIFPQ